MYVSIEYLLFFNQSTKVCPLTLTRALEVKQVNSTEMRNTHICGDLNIIHRFHEKPRYDSF